MFYFLYTLYGFSLSIEIIVGLTYVHFLVYLKFHLLKMGFYTLMQPTIISHHFLTSPILILTPVNFTKVQAICFLFHIGYPSQ
jgi:hypothetical protein